MGLLHRADSRKSYSGWRPQELGLIELKNVDIDNWFIQGGIKTDAGEDRLVPVHPRWSFY